jgi:alpha-ribazole phosphatase
LPRCAGLAAALARVLGTPLSLDPRLVELSFGDWEGRLWAELGMTDGERLRTWMTDWASARPPGGETVPELTARVQSWLGLVPEGVSCVVTHAGVIRALRVLLRRWAWQDAMGEPVPFLTWERFEAPGQVPL